MKKIGIIGAGRIVNWFLSDLNNSQVKDNFELFGIWNLHPQQAQDVAKKYNIKQVFKNVNELIDQNNQLDLIYIGTIDEAHYEYAKLALENKINVFVEKPLALNYIQAKELYDLAHKNEVLLFEGIKTGFAPAFQKAKAIIESKKMGAVRYVYATHAKVSTSGQIPNPGQEKQIAGFHKAGGMYALFSALSLCGPAKTIHYLNNPYQNNPAIQTSVLTIRHQNNAIANVIGSDAFTDDLATKIVMDQGYIKLGGRTDLYNQDYLKDSAHLPYTISVFDNQNNLIDFEDLSFKTNGEGLILEIEHIDYLLSQNIKESNIVTPEISLAIIKILDLTNNVNDLKVLNF